MGALGVFQIFINIALGVGVFFLAMRITRQPKDDPRLSRGLQLLQAKIAVLEDLSDRTDSQVSQLVVLLEQKIREVQNKIQLADKHVTLIRESMDRSLEVARIFQDKIPHEEIIERQNTKKYLKAARLANQGKTVDEIAQQVDLPMGELEFIAKVNRDQLMFSEEQLPAWAREDEAALAQAKIAESANPEEAARLSVLTNQQNLIQNLQQVQTELDQMLQTESVGRDFSGAFNVPAVATKSLNKLGEEFRKACDTAEAEAQPRFAITEKLSFVELTPPKDEEVTTSFETQTEVQKPLLDLSIEELENLKATAQAIPQQMSQAAKVLAQQAASIFKTAAQVDDNQTAAHAAPKRNNLTQAAQPAAGVSAVAAANAQAKAQMQPVDPRAKALAQARAAANELRKPQPRSSVNIGAPEIRKVEFPRIKSTNNLG